MNEIYRTLLAEWEQRNLPDVLVRDTTLESYTQFSPQKIIVLTGFRRTGKTYILFNLIKTLQKNKLVYINFEDERIPITTEFLTGLLPAIKKFYGEVQYIFLDEVHIMPNWSKWLRRVYDTEKIRFFVTGSSSKMSSTEIPTELRGRFLEISIFPLNFREFLRFRQVATQADEALIKKMLNEYICYGGLPEIPLLPEEKKAEVLRSYYNTVVRRDIIERFNIRSEENLKALLRLLLDSTQYTISKLYNTLKSLQYNVGKSTIQSFISHIEASYLMHGLPVFSSKVKDQMQWPRKVYFIDTGFVSQLSGKFSRNIGRMYENSVFLELIRRQKGDQELFYWKNQQHEEVDFVIKEGLKVKQLIQVCAHPEDFDTKKREVKALLKAMKEFGLSEALVITDDYEGEEAIKGKRFTFVPLWKWLLADYREL